MKIVCVGDCGIDRYIPSEKFYVGGITANFARHAMTTFAESDQISIVSVVGNDPEGQIVRSALNETRIDCQLTELDGATPVQYIEVREDGERDFVRYEEGVLRDFRFSEADIVRIAEADLLVAPVYLQIVGLFDDLMRIRTSGLVSVDFADFVQHPDFELLERYFDRIDIGFFGLGADDNESIARIFSLAEVHGTLAVVTLGPDGSRAREGNEFFECDAVKVDRVIDTTGAGDAYAAAFLASFCDGSSVGAAMKAGAELAARVVQRPGPI